MKTKHPKLNSFAVHPQFKSTYKDEKCHKLCNESSSGPSIPATTSGGGYHSNPSGTVTTSVAGASSLKSAFGGG